MEKLFSYKLSKSVEIKSLIHTVWESQKPYARGVLGLLVQLATDIAAELFQMVRAK
jgi:hypothetical protein